LRAPDICGDADDLFVDAKRQRVYISCGEGFLDVLDSGRVALPPGLRAVGNGFPGARTSLLYRKWIVLMLCSACVRL